jgi:hypothetical protein
LKKIAQIILSLILAFSIVIGYTGVTVYKMVCLTEQGKTIVSVTNITDECDHAIVPKSDCCLPAGKSKLQLQKTDNCCDYSYSLQKIEDTPVTQKVKNSTEHHLKVWQNFVAIFYMPFVLNNESKNIVFHSPPLKHQSTSNFLSRIQVYLI